MSGDFGGFGFDPEWLAALASQWQNGAQAMPMAGGMDLAKMGAPMPAPAGADPAAMPPPTDAGTPTTEQAAGILARMGLTGGGNKPGGASGGGSQGGNIATLLRGAGGLARPSGAQQGRPMAAAATTLGNRPRGGGELPYREATPGNPYLKRRKGLLDNE